MNNTQNESNLVYLETYVLQKDMRIRLPKSILENLKATRGISKFKIFYDGQNNQLILKKHEDLKSRKIINGDR